jgi:hypothetical protein
MRKIGAVFFNCFRLCKSQFRHCYDHLISHQRAFISNRWVRTSTCAAFNAEGAGLKIGGATTQRSSLTVSVIYIHVDLLLKLFLTKLHDLIRPI